MFQRLKSWWHWVWKNRPLESETPDPNMTLIEAIREAHQELDLHDETDSDKRNNRRAKCGR